jgi:hypothetical protein
MDGGDRMLRSLNRFLDVLFALAFFRTIEFLPMAPGTQLSTLPYGILSLIGSSPANVTRVVFSAVSSMRSISSFGSTAYASKIRRSPAA